MGAQDSDSAGRAGNFSLTPGNAPRRPFGPAGPEGGGRTALAAGRIDRGCAAEEP